MKRMTKRMAAVGAALLLVLAAGCGQQTVELDPTEALNQLKTEISFTDQMTDMDSAGAYAAYCLLMQAQGRTPAAPDTFDVERVAGFYGTSYAKSGLWLTAPDEIELWTDPALQTVTTVYDANRAEPIRQEGILFRAYLDEADKYPVFLSGNHARVHIETSAETGRHLLVIKDSYAHALAPFLAEEYQTINLVDLRYFKQETVSDWLAANPSVDEILFVYGLQSMAEDKTLQWLA